MSGDSDEPPPKPPPSRREEMKTAALDPKALTVASWPVVLVQLEQLAPWASYAMRLGVLALLQECVRAMTATDARASLLNEAQALIDTLRHFPWERK